MTFTEFVVLLTLASCLTDNIFDVSVTHMGKNIAYNDFKCIYLTSFYKKNVKFHT